MTQEDILTYSALKHIYYFRLDSAVLEMKHRFCDSTLADSYIVHGEISKITIFHLIFYSSNKGELISERLFLTSPAPPLPSDNYDTKTAASSSHDEKTEVIYGEENVTRWALHVLSVANETVDLCGDRYGPSIILANEKIMQKYIELHKRGVRQRHITDYSRKYHTLQKVDGISRAETSGWA
jgi:hypothetical protein